MKTVGQSLKEARLAKGISLGNVSRTTRIKEKFLLALEDSNWDSLPGFTTAQGFTRSYASAVGLDPNTAVALLRRDFPGLQAPTRSSEISLHHSNAWTPKTTILVATLATLLLLGWYLTTQYLTYAAAPPLEVKEFMVKDDTNQIIISGKTAPGISLEINGRAVLVEDDGTFNLEISRSGIGSSVEIRARSRTGKETVVRKPLN
jgi:cytoskeletal protein RodZ